MAKRDLIVIGTSSGGVQALQTLASGLPRGFPASLFAVCHLRPASRSNLAEILSRAGPLLATNPVDEERFYPGHIYVAPPDRHLTLEPEGTMRVTAGPRENNHRPAVDPLFRTAARHYGPRVIGVILSGALSDGVAGLMAIRQAGGLSIVQDPEEALAPFMPTSATQIAGADHVVPLGKIAPLLVELSPQSPPSHPREFVDSLDKATDVVEHDMVRQVRDQRRGQVSLMTCPGCGGTLWQINEGATLRFRCHVGHIYNADVLLAEQTDALEAALWTAVRTFREKSLLLRQLGERERSKGDLPSAQRYDEQAGLADHYGQLIVKYVIDGGHGGPNWSATPLPATG
jgi:two-component system chemotaxis response regulator CheB